MPRTWWNLTLGQTSSCFLGILPRLLCFHFSCSLLLFFLVSRPFCWNIFVAPSSCYLKQHRTSDHQTFWLWKGRKEEGLEHACEGTKRNWRRRSKQEWNCFEVRQQNKPFSAFRFQAFGFVSRFLTWIFLISRWPFSHAHVTDERTKISFSKKKKRGENEKEDEKKRWCLPVISQKN